MLLTSLTTALAVIIRFQSAVGHPHQLHPLHANKVRMLQWDFRNTDHRVRRACARRRHSTHPVSNVVLKNIAPTTTIFQHQRRSHHAPVNRLGAHPLDKPPVAVVQEVGDVLDQIQGAND